MGVFTLLRIAARNLRRNRRRSVITLVAMFLALTVMVTMRGFNNGINLLVRDQIIEAQGALQVHRKGFLRSIVATPLDLDLPADAQFLSRLRAVPHVRAIAPRIPCGGMVSAQDLSVFAAFIAVDPTEEVKVCPKLFADLTSGKPVQAASLTGSALTQLLLTRLGARLGERVVLITSDRDGVMNAVEVEITGTLKDLGQQAAEKKVAYVPLASIQELLRMPGRATELAVSVDELGHVDEVATSLRTALGPDFEVSTWRDLAKFDEEASKARDQGGAWLTYILLSLSLLGIVNTMLTSVRERTREIGTMMAVGMRRRHILQLFLAEAALLGLLGGLLGLLVGGALVSHFGAVGLKLPADDGISTFELHPYVAPAFMIRILLIAVLGAVAAALYPALRASRLRPIEALSQVAT